MTEGRRRETIAAIAVVLIIGLHAAVVGHLISRSLDHDEAEHLRAGEWIAAGKMPYRDFAENHTPYLHLLLSRFAPTTLDIDALRRYVTSARLLAAIAGTAAALCAAVFASQAAGDALAVIPALAVLLTRGWTYDRGVIDVRSEPFTLMLFWAGVVLIVRGDDQPRRHVLAGLGAGLIAVAAIWNPKWPLETAAIGVWYVAGLGKMARRSWRDAAVSAGVAVVLPAIALAVALRTVPFRALLFFAYRYPAAFYAWFRTSPLVQSTFRFEYPFQHCSEWFQPHFAIAGIVLLVLICVKEWRTLDAHRRRLLLLLGCFIVASALEIRFLYSYPRLWPQYYVMWGFSLAAAYGVVLSASVRKYFVWTAGVMVFVAGLYAAYAVSEIDHPVDQTHWRFKEAVLATLRPDEGVWMLPEDSPFVSPAGSYYWYAYKDQVPFSLAYAQTAEGRLWLPPLTEADLPPCRMLSAHLHGMPRGAVYVRYIDQRNLRNLPVARRCLAQLVSANFAHRVGNSYVLEVTRPPQRY